MMTPITKQSRVLLTWGKINFTKATKVGSFALNSRKMVSQLNCLTASLLSRIIEGILVLHISVSSLQIFLPKALHKNALVSSAFTNELASDL